MSETGQKDSVHEVARDQAENHARETVRNLDNGMIGRTTVRDLRDAIGRATRNQGVADAIKGSSR